MSFKPSALRQLDRPRGVTEHPTVSRRSACRVCDNVEGLDATYRCRRYLASVDSNGYRYCTDCGHVESVHP